MSETNIGTRLAPTDVCVTSKCEILSRYTKYTQLSDIITRAVLKLCVIPKISDDIIKINGDISGDGVRYV